MKRRGQIAVYLAMVLVAIIILVVMNANLFIAVRGKYQVQNAGDAAALSAARHQGHLLNEIGRLNIAHLYAAVKEDAKLAEGIVMSQRRLALLGPLEAVRSSNVAALLNGATCCPKRARFLHDHAKYVREVYASGDNDEGDPYPESWPGAWEEYANEIDRVAGETLAAGVDNIDFHNSFGAHLLLTRQFYDAIKGRDWCWFFFNCMSTLEGYRSYHDWAPLPKSRSGNFDNSEIYSLYVEFRQGSILEWLEIKEIAKLLEDSGYKVSEKEIRSSSLLRDRRATWAFLSPFSWRRWTEMKDFPIVGEVKAEYDYRGAAAICRVSQGDNNWTAAAKPFGGLEPDKPLFVKPVFNAVRLVPIDSVGGANLSTADIDWIRHIRMHLDYYLVHGPGSDTDCEYCKVLKVWEKNSFRHEGIIWLKHHSGSCTRSVSGGSGVGGGTVHGH